MNPHDPHPRPADAPRTSHSGGAPPPARSYWRSPAGIAAAAAALLGAYLLYRDHELHVWTALPFLILLACPLMHVFMHRGHKGGRHGTGPHARRDDTPGGDAPRSGH